MSNESGTDHLTHPDVHRRVSLSGPHQGCGCDPSMIDDPSIRYPHPETSTEDETEPGKRICGNETGDSATGRKRYQTPNHDVAKPHPSRNGKHRARSIVKALVASAVSSSHPGVSLGPVWYWIAPLALLASRILWQRRPGLAACALFWGLAVVVLLLAWPTGLAQYTFGLGVACNASVTLINGGYMPVATHRKLRGPARSLLGAETERPETRVPR